MCFRLRNTARRGLSGVPSNFFLKRACRAARSSPVVLLAISLLLGGRPLTGLESNDLARVPDSLALVGLRLSDLSDVGCDLAHESLVDSAYDDLLLSGALVRLHLEGDPGRGLHRNRVRVAHIEQQVASLELGAITDSD